MKLTKNTSDLKAYMVRLMQIGVAACYRGIIVSSDLYAALKAETDKFEDKIRITGVEGNRQLRYTFYVMEHPGWPKCASADGYFFTPHASEFYRENYLGHEDEVFRKSTQVETIDGVMLKEEEPIDGEIYVRSPFGQYTIHHAPFNELIKEVKTIAEQKGDMRDFLNSFSYRRGLYVNPPQTEWIDRPETYDYDKADLSKSIGRVLMRAKTGRGKSAQLEIVGIAVNGRGQLVEIPEKDSSSQDKLAFAKVALRHFLPEEIAAVISKFGRVVTPQEVADLRPVNDWWGQRYDADDLGRIHQWTSGEDTNSMSAYFTDSRAGWFSLELVKTQNKLEWKRVERQHFPKNWKGWEDTAHDTALKAFARSL